jgi:hypothetical protein
MIGDYIIDNREAIMEYSDILEGIKNKFEPKIRKVLEAMREVLKNEGYAVGEVYDMHDDVYRWSFLVCRDKSVEGDYNPSDLQDNDVDITFIIAESHEYDGTENGLNFMVNIVEVGGSILGGMCPFNYTEDVWVDINDPDAIEERFSYFEQSDPESIIDLL